MNMPKMTLTFGLLLVVLGVGTYGVAAAGMTSGKASFTALIPAIFGAVFIILGAMSMVRDDLRKHLMHGAAALALLAAIASLARAVPTLFRNSSDLSQVNGLAIGAQLAMGSLSLLFVLLCVQSFRAARRARAV